MQKKTLLRVMNTRTCLFICWTLFAMTLAQLRCANPAAKHIVPRTM